MELGLGKCSKRFDVRLLKFWAWLWERKELELGFGDLASALYSFGVNPVKFRDLALKEEWNLKCSVWFRC